MSYYKLAKNKDKKMCQVVFCRNEKNGHHGICSKHIMRRWRKLKLEKAAYAQVKESARKRSIPFSISLEEFIKAVEGTDYLWLKGRSEGCLHIDRIEEDKGYEVGNIRVLVCSDNVAKSNSNRKKVKNGEEQLDTDIYPF